MTANFFQSLDRHGVEYLLISGQAAVLYGAATFSEDIDLWINPSQENRDQLMAGFVFGRGSIFSVCVNGEEPVRASD